MQEKRYFILLVLFHLSVMIVGQTSDFRTWTGINIDGEIVKDLEFQITSELRLEENSSMYQSLVNDLRIQYDVAKFLDVGVIYRHGVKYDLRDGYYHSNRFSGFLSFRYDIKRFRLNYRALYEGEYSRMYTSENGMIPERMHRHKFGVKYNIRKNPITPELSSELFFVMDKNESDFLGMFRINTGASYRINKHWRLKILYRYQQEVNMNNPATSHIISSNIEYSF
jgi:hypothetical protein